jgi:ACS family hexuronate transporter-like MFS transporter
MPFSALAVFAPNPWVAILLVSLACSAHNGWSANIFTLVTDCFPSRAVGSVTGLVGFAGTGGGILATYLTGVIVQNFGYVPIFMLMGILHPLAMVFIHLFIKKGEPIDIEA